MPADGKLRVAVIMGGSSSEREVSLSSGKAVIKNLNPDKYVVSSYDPNTDLPRLAAEAKDLDVALIMIHGRGGEDGTLQGMLDLLGLPYQGSGVLGSALAMDKTIAKELYRAAGMPVADDVIVRKNEPDPVGHILEVLGLPVVVKPDCGGSSCGVSIVQEPDGLQKALEQAFALDESVLIEKYLKGRELTCGVLGNQELQALPLVEIIPNQDKYQFFNYEAKYQPGATNEICPARVDEQITAQVQALACQAHRVLRLKGYSRTDFILTEQGLNVLETNTIPGMTETSLLPQEAAAAGLEFPALLDRLIELALEA